jgi:hypothetical protein
MVQFENNGVYQCESLNLQQLHAYSLLMYATCFLKSGLLCTFAIERLEATNLLQDPQENNTSNKQTKIDLIFQHLSKVIPIVKNHLTQRNC